MPVIVRNVPSGHHWGWFSREDPRLHLQVVDEKHKQLGYKVWLEKHGKRVFEPAGEVPAKILRALKSEVAKQRTVIEDKWVRFMIRQGWLKAYLEPMGRAIKLVAYPQTEKRACLVPLYDENKVTHLIPEIAQRLKPEDVRLNDELASIEFWPKLPEDERHDIEIAPYLWHD